MMNIMLSFVAQLGSPPAERQAAPTASRNLRDKRRMAASQRPSGRTNNGSLEAAEALRQRMCDCFDKRRVCKPRYLWDMQAKARLIGRVCSRSRATRAAARDRRLVGVADRGARSCERRR